MSVTKSHLYGPDWYDAVVIPGPRINWREVASHNLER